MLKSGGICAFGTLTNPNTVLFCTSVSWYTSSVWDTTNAWPYGDGAYIREPNFSSVGAVLGSWPGGFAVVKPPEFGSGRIGDFDAGRPGVVLGVASVLRPAMKRSPV